MTHLLFIYFLISLIAGVIAIIFSIISFFYYGRQKHILYRLFVIVSFSCIVFPEVICTYIYNVSFNYTGPLENITRIAIILLIFSLPLYINEASGISHKKIINGIFFIFGGLSAILYFIFELFFNKSVFLFYSSVLILTIIYSSITGIIFHKQGIKSNSWSRFWIGIISLILFPGFFIDIHAISIHPAITEMPISIVIVPGFYMIWNIFFIVEDIGLILKKPSKELIKSDISEFCTLYKLSPREKEVIKLLLEGKSYEKIGVMLFISKATVKTHIRRIYEKTGVTSKMELANRLLH